MARRPRSRATRQSGLLRLLRRRRAKARRLRPSPRAPPAPSEDKQINPPSTLAHPHNNSSFGVMEDHADRMTAAGAKPAYAVAHIDTIGAARPLHRADLHSKRHAVTLAKRH